MGIFRGPGGTGDATGDAANEATLAIAAAQAAELSKNDAANSAAQAATSAALLSGALVATNNLSDVTNASTSRQNLGLEIGVNVQAYDANNVTSDSTQTLTNKTLTSPIIDTATISGGTINNASVGATTPAAGTFTSLTDSGNLTFTGTGNRILGDFSNATASSNVAFQTSTVNGNTAPYIIPNGTSTTAGLTFSNSSSPDNSSLALYRITSTDMRFVSAQIGTGSFLPITMFTSGSERMRIDTSGNVGIGSSNPFEKLDVAGNVRIRGTGEANMSVGGTTSQFVFTATDSDYAVISATGTHLGTAIVYGAGVAVFDNATGALDVDGTVSATTFRPAAGSVSAPAFSTSGDTNTGVFFPAADTIAFAQGGNEVMRMDFASRVGIGTTSPAHLFEVRSPILCEARIGSEFEGDSNGVARLFVHADTGSNSYPRLTIEADGDFQTSTIKTTNSFPLLFGTNNTERIRITSSGNVGIGTSSPSTRLAVAGGRTALFPNNEAFALQLNNGTASNGPFLGSAGEDIFVVSTSGGTERMRIDSSGNLLVGTTDSNIFSGDGIKLLNDTPRRLSVVSSASTAGGGETYLMYSTGASAYRFYVDWAGSIFATSIVISAISDERLKENIKDIDTGIDSIMALKPRRFDWKDGKGQDKKNVAGFIAQEFETVFPECVGTTKAGQDGIEYKNINHETLIPTLVKAIQEQQALIENLTTRLTALEGN
jgi:hypothetical protein